MNFEIRTAAGSVVGIAAQDAVQPAWLCESEGCRRPRDPLGALSDSLAVRAQRLAPVAYVDFVAHSFQRLFVCIVVTLVRVVEIVPA